MDSILVQARTPFEVVRRGTLSQLFFKLKIDHMKDGIEQLVTVKSVPALFPDMKETLTRLKDMSISLMSVFFDGDPQSLDNTVTGLGIPVDRAISADQPGYHKPHSSAQAMPTKKWVCRVCKRYDIPIVDFYDSQAALEVSGPAGLGDRLTEL